MESPEKYQANMPWYQEQISNCTYRQFTTGFFYGKPDENTQIYDNNTYQKEYTYLGFAEAVDDRGFAQITQRNKFSAGETIEIMKPDGQNLSVTVKGIYDEEGNPMESAPHAQQKLFVDLEQRFRFMTFYEELNKRIQERQPQPTKEDVGCGYLFSKRTRSFSMAFFSILET